MNDFKARRSGRPQAGYSAPKGRYSGSKQARMGRGPGGSAPGGFGNSRKGRKFKSRPGDNRRGNGGGSYADGFNDGLAQAVRIGYRF